MNTNTTEKLKGVFKALLYYYLLPLLLIDYHLLGYWPVWIPMFAVILIFYTQPTVSREQIDNPTDRNTMKWLAIGTAISQAWVVVEWGLAQSAVPETSEWKYWAGGVLIVSGLIIRIWSIRTLGKYFGNDVRVLADHQLIEDGLYSIVRHPSYLGALLTGFGIAVFLQVHWGLWITPITLLASYGRRIAVEEDLLGKEFGDRYREYQNRTYRIVPWVW